MRIVGIGSVLVALVCAASVQAATINVKPKPDALQKAIDKAKKGDTLLVKDGTYKESVEVTKPLDILGENGPRPVINGGCDTDIVIDVQSRGVKLEHMKVKGASDNGGPGYTVNLIGVPTGTLSDLAIQQSCEDSPEYGINIFDSGNLELLNNRTYGGFEDAGIYIGGIEDTRGKTLFVAGNISDGNNRGIIVEDSFSNDQDIRLESNSANANDTPGVTGSPTGIYIHNSDNGTYVDNVVADNGSYGFDIDAPSDDNVFNNNNATGNGDENFHDLGSGSCGSGNSFALPACM
jgi:parallel beta-helix repeat protein